MVWRVFACLMILASKRNKKMNFFADPILIKINCSWKLSLNKMTYFQDLVIHFDKIYGIDYRGKEICYRSYRLLESSSLTLICIKWVPEDPSTTFLATSSTQKVSECSDSMNSSICIPESIWYHLFTWSGLNSQEILTSFWFSLGLWGPKIETKFTISWKYGPTQVKL